MPKRCVAVGCSNTTDDGVSLFSFPKDPQLSKKWSEQVKRTRDKWDGPTKYSFLCSCHFKEECFEVEKKLAESLGVGKWKARLKPGAIPTIFKKPLKAKTAADSLPQKRRRVAYEKRERARVKHSYGIFICI